MSSSVRPPALEKGDRIRVIAPSGAFDPARFTRAAGILEQRGYEVVYREDIFERLRYLAGDDERRADEVNEAFADSKAKAILAARGGYGAARILPLLDWDLIAANPKVIVGCSDMTALHQALALKTGAVTFHGPFLAGKYGFPLTEEEEQRLFGLISEPTVAPPIVVEEALCLSEGRAQGMLRGGCLSIICSLLGTEWAPDFAGCILFLEDIGEAPYRYDRLLTQLVQSGAADGVAGLVFGTNPGCHRDHDSDYTLQDVIMDVVGPLDVPVLYGVPSGHARPNLTLPLGVDTVIDAAGKRLEFTEPAVSAA